MSRPPLLIIAAQVYLCAIVIFTLFHLALIFGAPWGALTMGGTWPGVLPIEGSLVSVVSIAILWALAWPVAAAADMVQRKPPPKSIYAVLAYQLLAIMMHLATPSALERMIWLPMVLVMTVAVIAVLKLSAK